VISNNIANLAHHRLQEGSARHFQDLTTTIVRPRRRPGSAQGTILPSASTFGGASRPSAPAADEQGTLSQTATTSTSRSARRLFKIHMPDGTYTYSRAGSFQRTAGRVVTAQGNPVQPTITIRRTLRHHHQGAGPALGHACPEARPQATTPSARSA